MTWQLYRWTWRVESPLYIGMPPAGSLERSRVYLPAQTLWGALTAEIARAGNAFPAYESIGNELKAKTRLGYLYPAELVNGGWLAWLPEYREKTGLLWVREDGAKYPDRAFRSRLLYGRPGTAIAPDNDSALDRSLHETECLQARWQDTKNPVALVGYVFAQSGYECVQNIETLFVGGDTRYGMGRLRRVAFKSANKFFGYQTDLTGLTIETDRVLAHAEANDLIGAREWLAQWNWREFKPGSQAFWMPGSSMSSSGVWQIKDSGGWTR